MFTSKDGLYFTGDSCFVVMSILNGYKNIECVLNDRESACKFADEKNFGNDLRDKQYYVLEMPIYQVGI